MSLENSLDRIIELVSDSHEKAKAKGGTTSTPYLLANLPDAIESIPEASDPVLQEKTVSPSTSAQEVVADAGYDGLSKVNVNAVKRATQATPSVSVSEGGLITAYTEQEEGYVEAGEKTATKQLATQAAKTVTPSTSEQTAVASGRYTTGAVTVKGDANLVPANIVSGKSIFGVSGSATAGEDVTAETNAYTTELAELTTAVTALENELAGKAAGGGGDVDFITHEVTITNNGMYQPLINEYVLTSSDLNSSNKRVIMITSYTNICGIFFRPTLTDDFIYLYGYRYNENTFTDIDLYLMSGANGGVSGENEITMYGRIGSDYISESIEIISM